MHAPRGVIDSFVPNLYRSTDAKENVQTPDGVVRMPWSVSDRGLAAREPPVSVPLEYGAVDVEKVLRSGDRVGQSAAESLDQADTMSLFRRWEPGHLLMRESPPTNKIADALLEDDERGVWSGIEIAARTRQLSASTARFGAARISSR